MPTHDGMKPLKEQTSNKNMAGWCTGKHENNWINQKMHKMRRDKESMSKVSLLTKLNRKMDVIMF